MRTVNAGAPEKLVEYVVSALQSRPLCPHLPVYLLKLLQHPTGHTPAAEKVGASLLYSTEVTLPLPSCASWECHLTSEPQFDHAKTGVLRGPNSLIGLLSGLNEISHGECCPCSCSHGKGCQGLWSFLFMIFSPMKLSASSLLTYSVALGRAVFHL